METLEKRSGIYAILNLIDCKVYIGQAKDFNQRDHLAELDKKNDNLNLVHDYNNGKEFIYMILADWSYCDTTDYTWKEELNFLERYYIMFFQNILGYELYNLQIPEKKRFTDSQLFNLLYEINGTNQTFNDPNLNLEDALKELVMKNLDEDFKVRFKLTPIELLSTDVDCRRNILEEYFSMRLDLQKEQSPEYKFVKMDRVIFNRNRIKSILKNREEPVSKLSDDLDEFIKSSAGNYIGEGIDQILNYELKTIEKKKYCLWTFASNALYLPAIRQRCIKRHSENKETYVLFSYTPSSTYAAGEAYAHRYLDKRHTSSKKIDSDFALTKADLAFLNFASPAKMQYSVPDDIDVTSSSATSACAFVIDDLFLLQENLTATNDILNQYYEAIKKDGTYELGRSKRSTYYLKEKGVTNFNEIFESEQSRRVTIVGRLTSPYIISLQNH